MEGTSGRRDDDDPDRVAHQIADLCLRGLLFVADAHEHVRHDFPTAVDEYPAQ